MKKKDKKDFNLTEEQEKQIQEQIDRLLEEAGLDHDAVKIVAVKVPERKFFYVLFESLFYILLNAVLFISINGYLEFCSPNIIDTLFVSLAFSGLEILFRNVMFIFWRKVYVRYLIIIDILSVLIASVLTYAFPFFTFTNSILLFFVCVIAIICVRNLIKKYTFDKLMSKKRK